MSTAFRRTLTALGGLAVAGTVALSAPGTATAAPASTALVSPQAGYACGYDGYTGSNGEQPLYNHCGNSDVEIKVSHFFWGYTYYCATPGTHEIPQGNNSLRIIYATADRRTC